MLHSLRATNQLNDWRRVVPPSRPYSPEELIEVLRRVADTSLQQSAANNRLATAVDKLIPPFEQLRRDIYDIKTDRETDQAKADMVLSKLNTDLAVLVENARRTQDDVRELAKDVTGSQLLHRDDRTSIERAIAQFEGLKTSTKIIIAVVALGAAVSGWLTHLISSLAH
jgi:hypothetical protein